MTAMADGHLHPAEKEILQKLPIYLQIKNDAYHRFESAIAGNSSSVGNLEQFYATLEVDQNATDAEIKKAYRKKCQEYHPDKLASKGLPEGFTKFANEQMSQFSDAYDKITNSRRKHVQN